MSLPNLDPSSLDHQKPKPQHKALLPGTLRTRCPHECAGASKELFSSSMRNLKPLLHKKCNVSLPPLNCLPCSTANALQYSTLLLGTPGILCGWALRDTFRLGPAKIFGVWTLQGYSAVGHCRDTLQLGTARILSG